MEFKNCAILLTENCNARCKMCCDSRGLVRGKTLSKEELTFILNEIKAIPTITHIGITGGEPLLYPNLVEKILTFDFERDVSVTIKTNGFWGQNLEKASRFVSKNAKRIQTVSLSYDDFHREFIDIDSIKNVITVCKNFNIPTEVVGCFLTTGSMPGDILNELGECAYYTHFLYQPVMSTGSGNCFKNSEYIKLVETDIDKILCPGVFAGNILINPKLDVYPCCSQAIENTILLTGNLNTNSLMNIILDIKQNYIFNTIFIDGFAPYIKLLKNYHLDYPKKLASPCELCEFIFKNDDFLILLDKIKYYENL